MGLLGNERRKSGEVPNDSLEVPAWACVLAQATFGRHGRAITRTSSCRLQDVARRGPFSSSYWTALDHLNRKWRLQGHMEIEGPSLWSETQTSIILGQ